MKLRLPVLSALAVAICVVVACAAPPRNTFPPLGSTPAPPGDATAATRQQVIGALAAAGLQAEESARAFRPPEGPLLAAAPRTTLQVTLPDDPARGFIVIYGLASPELAQAAATDHAVYIASPPGRIQFPLDTHFVLRLVGSTVVFHHWSPGSSPDPRMPMIETVLTTVGTEIPIPD